MCPRSLRIKVISPVDPRRAGTNAIADVRLCAALGRLGHSVEWIVPTLGRRSLVQDLDIWQLHGLARTFDVRLVRSGQGGGPGDLTRVAPLVLRGAGLALRRSRLDYVISRDLRLLAPALLARRGSIAVPWMHEYRGEPWEAFLCRRVGALMATNSAIVNDASRAIPGVRAFVTGNPIPQQWIDLAKATTRSEAREQLGLTVQKPLVVYTGRIYIGMAELEYLLAAAAAVEECHFLMTGGQPAAIRSVRSEIERRGLGNITLTGMLERPEDARLYQIAADVLVSYYSRRDHPLAHHNLPNKLAEYMATGNPVILADFPAVRDLARPDSAVMVAPDAPRSFVASLRALVRDPARAAQLGARAQNIVSESSYERVAEDVARFLEDQPR